MKADRLKNTLQKLKDDEQKSKLRNDSLIHDFERVNNMAEGLETKARKLKKVKVGLIEINFLKPFLFYFKPFYFSC